LWVHAELNKGCEFWNSMEFFVCLRLRVIRTKNSTLIWFNNKVESGWFFREASTSNNNFVGVIPGLQK
jgi:hypothetical protein